MWCDPLDDLPPPACAGDAIEIAKTVAKKIEETNAFCFMTSPLLVFTKEEIIFESSLRWHVDLCMK